MTSKRRLLFLLGLLLSLASIQQFLVHSRLRSSRSQDAEYQVRFEEFEQLAKLGETEAIRSGVMWIGELHDGQEYPLDGETKLLQVMPGPQKIISKRIDFEQGSLSAIFELHECSAGSPLCSSGGGITVLAGNRIACRVSMWVLQPPEAMQTNLYKVWWELREDGLPFTEGQRLKMLRQLAGTSEYPNRPLFHRLIRIAYGYAPQTVLPESSESVEQQVVRAVCQAILRSRADQTVFSAEESVSIQ